MSNFQVFWIILTELVQGLNEIFHGQNWYFWNLGVLILQIKPVLKIFETLWNTLILLYITFLLPLYFGASLAEFWNGPRVKKRLHKYNDLSGGHYIVYSSKKVLYFNFDVGFHIFRKWFDNSCCYLALSTISLIIGIKNIFLLPLWKSNI